MLNIVPKSLSPLLKLLPINASFDDTDGQIKKNIFPNSPCPSPTPIFQQLYLALANWDRLVSESPDSRCLILQSDYTDCDSAKEKIIRSNSLASSVSNNGELIELPKIRRKSTPADILRVQDEKQKDVKPPVQIRINNS